MFVQRDGKSPSREGGSARSRWVMRGVERECLRSVSATWGWLRDGRESKSGDVLQRVLLRKFVMEVVEPSGRPRRVTPSSQGAKGMNWSSGGMTGFGDGEVSWLLAVFSLRCVCGRELTRYVKVLATSSGGPKMFPSSRYQVWKEDGARAGRDEMVG
jgi:hypothetical protein